MKIKQVPEDFKVIEKFDIKFSSGDYSYYLLHKRDLSTLEACKIISLIWKKDVSYAGNKDKKAVTEQYISVKNGPEKDLNEKKFSLKFVGKGSVPISLGDHSGNYFEIVVRDIDKLPKIKKEFVNYFGEQRFSKNNAEIGKLLVKKEFGRAAELLKENGTLKEIDNPVQQLNKLERKLLMLFVNSYQSELWNKMAKTSKEKEIPLIGFGTEETSEINHILKEEGITTRDFVIKQLRGVSSEGGFRERVATADELEVGKLEDDELNKGKKKVLLKFFLNKGCYATEFLRQNFI